MRHAMFIVVLVSSAGMLSPPVHALCPGVTPLLQEEANNNPVYLQTCIPAGGCSRAAVPTIVSVDTQEAIVRATPSFSANKVVWKAFYEDANGFFQELWEYSSTAGAPYPGGQAIDFGAPGLPANTDVAFKVSFCDDAYCKCWSVLSTSMTTQEFSGAAPDPFEGASEEVEASFDLPETSSMLTGGDGLGPMDVWMSNGYIADDKNASEVGGSVFLPHSSGMIYDENSTDEHSFAEAWVRNDLEGLSIAGGGGYTADDYNFDVAVRQYGTPGQGFAYYVKVVNESGYNGGKKTLALGYISGGMRHEYLGTTEWVDLSSVTIPLDTEDPNRADATLPVLLRIEVRDLDATRSELTGYLAWGCSSGTIDQCSSVYTVGPLVDNSAISHGLHGVKGMPGASAHHTGHYVDFFRAGSDGTP